MKIDVRHPSFPRLLLVAETKMTLQGKRPGRATDRGCLRQTHPQIKISRAALNMEAQRHGSSREVYSWNGSLNQANPCCGSTANVRPSVPARAPRY